MVRRILGVSVTAGAIACFISGCSDLGNYPAVHDMPAPRADTTLTPDQVKQETDSLVNERDHLSSEAQAVNGGNPGSQQKPAATVQPVSAQAPESAGTTAAPTAYARPQ